MRAGWEGPGNQTRKNVRASSEKAGGSGDSATQLDKDRGGRAQRWKVGGLCAPHTRFSEPRSQWFPPMCVASLCNCLPFRKGCQTRCFPFSVRAGRLGKQASVCGERGVSAEEEQAACGPERGDSASPTGLWSLETVSLGPRNRSQLGLHFRIPVRRGRDGSERADHYYTNFRERVERTWR